MIDDRIDLVLQPHCNNPTSCLLALNQCLHKEYFRILTGRLTANLAVIASEVGFPLPGGGGGGGGGGLDSTSTCILWCQFNS